MRTTLSVIKADIGSVGGHTKPSQRVIERVKEFLSQSDIINDFKIFHIGDDITILFSHEKGANNSEIHKLAWDAFIAGTQIAKEQGLYGAGQDLLKDSFSGNVKGLGPAVAEIEFEERPNEPFVVFMADKTDPGAYNFPLFMTFADPMHNAGFLLSQDLFKGFKFVIMDVSFRKDEKEKVIELEAPEDWYDIACLLRDPERYVVESIYSRTTGEQCVSVSTTRLRNIAGKYVGKDDPVVIVRTQKTFPGTGEVLSPYSITPYVAGFNRGSHNGPLMPVKHGTIASFFDGPPIVGAVGLCVHNGKFTEGVDLFDHPFWDYVRTRASEKAFYIREQGFFGPAMLGMEELEYGGVVKRLEGLAKKFKVR